jgi:hypothetical protein
MAAIQAGQRLSQRTVEGWQPACVATRAGQPDVALASLEHNAPTALNRRLFMLHACLGNKGRAVEYAGKMYAEREPLLPAFLAYPETAALRGDPALEALRQRIGLPR